MMDSWNGWFTQLYIRLSKNTSPERTEGQLETLLNKYDKDVNKNPALQIAFHLQPLKDIHFDNKYVSTGVRITDKSALFGLLAMYLQ
jgi:hypothetical protein